MNIIKRYLGTKGLSDLLKLKLSELIIIATDDLARAHGKKNEGYVIDMDAWGHRYEEDGNCYGCYAGQCLLRRIKGLDNVERFINDDYDARRVAYALNAVRNGYIESAIQTWNEDFKSELYDDEAEVTKIANWFYHYINPQNPEEIKEFIKQTRRLAKKLAALGL